MVLSHLRIILTLALLGLGHSPALAAAPLELLGVDAWHARGLKGAGVTVAVLDNGFRGYQQHLGKGLPSKVKTQSFRRDGDLEARDSTHGILCAEIIHRLAPDAKLLFANWEPDHPESFLMAVKWCREQGASIISCSIIMPGWSDGHGAGHVHRELHKLVDGALFFASAGNLARRHWNGPFRNDGHGSHEWKPGRIDNTIRPWGTQAVSIEISGPRESTYRLRLLDELDKPIGIEQKLLVGGVYGSTIRFLPDKDRAYRLRVELTSGDGREMRLIVLGAELEIASPNNSIVFPGDGAGVIAVGAVSDSGERDMDSSIGTIRPGIKPECVATVPVPSAIRALPFQGTSAAAPQAAGLAALLWSKAPVARSADIRKQLLDACVDLGQMGPDAETGYGRVRLPKP
ncbi:MAG: S8 family serine peptidase [Planctomycetes bacterium]|nr:S8 family serine peptidase [Planctomycetota bacterium]